MSVRLPIVRSLVLLIVGATSAAAQQVQTPPGLDVSLPAAKRLSGARDLIAAQDWGAAITALERLSEDFGGSLIEIEHGRFLNVRYAVAATLAGLPTAGLDAYRRRTDPAMELAFLEARDRHSPLLMRQVVRDGFATSFGDDALGWLAEEALETGDIDGARRWWTALVRPPPGAESALLLRYPDAALEPAEVTARLVLCSLLQGDHQRARQELDVFAARFGDADGQLAGRAGQLAKLLAELLAVSREWSAPAAAMGIGHSADGSSVDLAANRWTQSLVWPGVSGELSIDSERLGRASAPPVHPAVWNDVLVVPGINAVRALNLADGTPRWPTGAAGDDGTLYADPPAGGSSQAPSPRFGRSICEIADGRCYARLAAPTPAPPSAPAAMPASRVVCLDLHAQGRLVWMVGSDERTEFPDGRFSGPPLASGDRVHVPVRWGAPHVEIGIACFDAGTGELRWHRRVCTALDAGAPTGRLDDQDVLTAGAEHVYLLPSNGLLTACDAATGELAWAVTDAANASWSDSEAVDAVPGAIVCDGGRVFAKPGDSNLLLAFAADDGRRLWSLDLPSRVVDLLGVSEGRLIASGDHLWGLEVATGQAWRFGYDDPEGYGYGRGAVAGGHVYWPTHDELFVVAAHSGQLVDRILFNPASGITGGNLTIADEALILAGHSLLTSFGPSNSH